MFGATFTRTSDCLSVFSSVKGGSSFSSLGEKSKTGEGLRRFARWPRMVREVAPEAGLRECDGSVFLSVFCWCVFLFCLVMIVEGGGLSTSQSVDQGVCGVFERRRRSSEYGGDEEEEELNE